MFLFLNLTNRPVCWIMIDIDRNVSIIILIQSRLFLMCKGVGMGGKISAVIPDSIGEELGLEAGDLLLSINDQPVRDVIDYNYCVDEDYLRLTVEKTRRRSMGLRGGKISRRRFRAGIRWRSVRWHPPLSQSLPVLLRRPIAAPAAAHAVAERRRLSA